MKLKKKLENIKITHYLKNKGYFTIGKTDSIEDKKISKKIILINPLLNKLIQNPQTTFSLKIHKNSIEIQNAVKKFKKQENYSLIFKCKDLYFFEFKESIKTYKLNWLETILQLNFILAQQLKLFQFKNLNKQIKN